MTPMTNAAIRLTEAWKKLGEMSSWIVNEEDGLEVCHICGNQAEAYACYHCDETTCMDCATPHTYMNPVEEHRCEVCNDGFEAEYIRSCEREEEREEQRKIKRRIEEDRHIAEAEKIRAREKRFQKIKKEMEDWEHGPLYKRKKLA